MFQKFVFGLLHNNVNSKNSIQKDDHNISRLDMMIIVIQLKSLQVVLKKLPTIKLSIILLPLMQRIIFKCETRLNLVQDGATSRMV